MGIAKLTARVLLVCDFLILAWSVAAAEGRAPEIVSISPTSGPEGSRVEIAGKNLQGASAVLLGTASSTFKLISPEKLIALVPRKATTSAITVITPSGRAVSPFAFLVSNDLRVPDGVGWKAGYVNPVLRRAISTLFSFGGSPSPIRGCPATNRPRWKLPGPSFPVA